MRRADIEPTLPADFKVRGYARPIRIVSIQTKRTTGRSRAVPVGLDDGARRHTLASIVEPWADYDAREGEKRRELEQCQEIASDLRYELGEILTGRVTAMGVSRQLGAVRRVVIELDPQQATDLLTWIKRDGADV
jgi:hypothetical protein